MVNLSAKRSFFFQRSGLSSISVAVFLPQRSGLSSISEAVFPLLRSYDFRTQRPQSFVNPFVTTIDLFDVLDGTRSLGRKCRDQQ